MTSLVHRSLCQEDKGHVPSGADHQTVMCFSSRGDAARKKRLAVSAGSRDRRKKAIAQPYLVTIGGGAELGAELPGHVLVGIAQWPVLVASKVSRIYDGVWSGEYEQATSHQKPLPFGFAVLDTKTEGGLICHVQVSKRQRLAPTNIAADKNPAPVILELLMNPEKHPWRTCHAL